MSIVKYLMIATALLAAGIGLANGALDASGGAKLLVVLAVPIALGLLSMVRKQGLPRWAGGVSLVAFLLAAMWTTEPPFDNVMMASALGMVLALLLTIRPDHPRLERPA